MFDKVLNQFSKQDLFHRASRVDTFSLGYITILDEYRVAANYHKSQRTVACRSELGHIDVRRLIFLVRSASAIRCSWNSTLFRTSALLIDTVYHGRASSPSPEIVISLAKSCDIQQRRRQQQRRQQQGAVDASDVGRQTFRRKTSQKKKHSWSSKE